MSVRRSLSLGGLLLSLTACQALPPGGLFAFSLDATETAVPIGTAGAVAPGPTPTPPGGARTPVLPGAAPGGPGGGGPGGGASVATVTGLVTDAAGRALAGATVSGGGATATTDASGAFSLRATGPLTVSRAGYGSQTLGAPYRFALVALDREPGAPYTISGTTLPAAAGAQVLFVDAAGTSAAALTAPDGTFELEVEPRSAADTPGLLAVTTDFALPIEPRFGVLQATTPRCGAVRLAHPGADRVDVALGAATGVVSIAPAPAPMGVTETAVQLVDETGLVLPLGATEGPFPGALPTFTVPGLRHVVTIQSREGARQALVERADPAPGETWRPQWLTAPEAYLTGDVVHITAAGRVAVTLAPKATQLPVWQAIAEPGDVSLPTREATPYVLRVSAVEGAPATASGFFGGALTDRRSATTEIELLPPLP